MVWGGGGKGQRRGQRHMANMCLVFGSAGVTAHSGGRAPGALLCGGGTLDGALTAINDQNLKDISTATSYPPS